MAAVQPPYVIQALANHPARLFREMLATLRGQAGVIGSADMAVTQNSTPNMSVLVAAGKAVIDGTQAFAAQGSYVVYNDATVNLTIAAADPTNPRNDLIVAQVRDAEYSGANNDWLLAVIQGTAAASPVDPAVPANALTLARVRVNAAASSIVNANITDLRPIGTIINVAVTPADSAGAAAIGTSPLAARADHAHRGMQLFGTRNGDGTTNKISFTGIPSTFSFAILRWKARTTSATNGEDAIQLQFNTDVTGNYSNQRLSVNAGSATAVDGGTASTSLLVGYVAGGGIVNTVAYGEGVAEISAYNDTALGKTVRGWSMINKSFSPSGQFEELIAGSWNSSSAVNQIDALCGAGFWTTLSKFWLYLL